MLNNLINEIDQKSLMLTLSLITNNLNFTKVGTTQNTIYTINSTDNTLNINIDFENDKTSSYNDLVKIIKYCYETHDYTLDNIQGNSDLLEYIYKYINAIILEIEKESQILTDDTKNHPTKTQLNILHKIIELENLCTLTYNTKPNTYSAMIVSKFIAESVQQASLFLSSTDLLDYMKVIFAFSQELPCHEDDIWLKCLTDIITSYNNQEVLQ